MSELTAAELCAGYDGLGMAVKKVFNARTLWVSEYDEAPSRILAHHYPDIPNYGDMTKIDWATVPKVDIVSGGTPCQDLSHAGRRAGMVDGTRSNLAVEYLRAVEIIKPKYAIWENVRGAYSANADSSLESCPRCMGEVGGQESLLCGHLAVYSETFPTSGMTLNGVAYELPTWEPRTADSASSSSQDDATILRLPTPVAQDAKNSSNPPAAHARNTPPLAAITNYFPRP